MEDYRWYYGEEWEQRREHPIELRDVAVKCDGRVIPGVTAPVCRYIQGGFFSLYTNEYQDGRSWPADALHTRATRVLRASGHILPFESVGYPECTAHCVTLKRYSEVDLEPRRQTLKNIPVAARAMIRRRTATEHAVLGWAHVAAATNFPEDLEHYVHQFLRPQTWRTWSQFRSLCV